MEKDINNGINDNDDIEIIEVTKSEENPTNITLYKYFENLEMKYRNNKGTTLTENNRIGIGDKRADISKKFNEYLILYDYVLSNLKDNNLKNDFKKNFNPIIDYLHSGNKINSIEYEFIRNLNLVCSNYVPLNQCKGYIIRNVNNNEKYVLGFILIKNELKSKIDIYPFIRGHVYNFIKDSISFDLNDNIFESFTQVNLKFDVLNNIFINLYNSIKNKKLYVDNGFIVLFNTEGNGNFGKFNILSLF